jgi:predicted metal-binding membrane protein
LRQDRAVVLGGLAGVSVLAWAYTAEMATRMAQPLDMVMPAMHRAGPSELVMLFTMWLVMMAAMMVPSAAPVILLFANLNRRRRERRSPAVPTSVFLLGYLLVWSAYSLLAAGAQLALREAALLSPTMAAASPLVGGGLLLAAGLYQWTPLKRACLAHCRSPLHFLSTEWREGPAGALRMGLRHGTYCVGCCWLLMALLFVAGVMNLLWVAAIAAFVLLEKVVPAGGWIGRVAGAVLVAWGAWVISGGAP